MKFATVIAAAAGLACLSAEALARDDIKIIGSSTVYPFTAAVADKLNGQGMEVDVVSSGTGGGFNAFCLGYGDWWPDINNASRPMKDIERQSCANRGVDGITEIKIGYDGIVLARSVTAPPVTLTRKDIFLALAERIATDGALADNPNTTWNSVNAGLPDAPISVYGPPPSSGTRDNFEGLAMAAGCDAATDVQPILEEVEDLAYCRTMRGDPYYVEAGEDDAQIVQVLQEDAAAFGVFGYSYAATNPARIQTVAIDGIAPTPRTIADGSYPLSRPLYIYVKNNRLAEVPDLKAFLEEYISNAALGPDGYLAKIGLVTLSPAELAAAKEQLAELLSSSVASN